MCRCCSWAMLGVLSVLLLANLALVSPATLVPRISDVNGFQLEPHNDQYTLRVHHPDGTSARHEVVKEIAPGEFEIRGTLNQLFADRHATLEVNYEAGRNGYVAKYKYTAEKKPTPPEFVILLSPKLLMSASG